MNTKVALREGIGAVLKADKKYIFCAAVLGRRVKKQLNSAGYKVDGFIDNNADKMTNTLGLPLFKLEDIDDKNALIIIASVNYVYEIYVQLKNAGFKNVIPSYLLHRICPDKFPAEPVFKDLTSDLEVNAQKYTQTRALFKDEKSLRVFDTIIEFRKTYDIEAYATINDGIENDYFEEFIKYNGEPFVDGGGFDGDTVLSFLKNYGDRCSKIYFFEPDKISYQKACENLKNLDVQMRMQGLSDSYKTLKFSNTGTFGSAFSDSGDLCIECVALDEVVKEKRCFIKLDIEGFELEALKGARRLIENGSILAVCAYHKAQDIWQLPEFILSVNPDYDCYLRHYTTNIFETVFYAVPKSLRKKDD